MTKEDHRDVCILYLRCMIRITLYNIHAASYRLLAIAKDVIGNVCASPYRLLAKAKDVIGNICASPYRLG